MPPHRPIERRRGLPLPARLLLGFAVIALGGIVLWAATGQLGRSVAGVGGWLGGIVDQVTATAAPTPAPSVAIDAPSLTPPTESYTSQSTVDLTGTLPASIVGQGGYKIRLYLALKGQQPAPISDTAVGTTARFVIPGVALERGVNNFSASLVGPSGSESERSAEIRFVLDVSVPKVVLTSPKDGDTINADTVQLVGKSQSRSQLVARNEANGVSRSATAASDGTFTIDMPLEKGPNGITITVTDPAGNSSSSVIGVTRGSGVLTVALHASGYRFKASKLPHALTLTADVTDPDGKPLEGAAVTFTLSVPGIPVITQDAVTDGTGTAVFQTTIPQGATLGTGPATAFVTSDKFGTTSSRIVVSIIN